MWYVVFSIPKKDCKISWDCPLLIKKEEDGPEDLPWVGPGEAAGGVVHWVQVRHVRRRHHVPGKRIRTIDRQQDFILSMQTANERSVRIQ
jgi:hypothetical protein